jgi:hypothetical protein
MGVQPRMDLYKIIKEFFLFAFPIAMIFFFVIVVKRKEIYDVRSGYLYDS